MRGGTERGDSLVKEGWYTAMTVKKVVICPLKKRGGCINAIINLSEKALGYLFLHF